MTIPTASGGFVSRAERRSVEFKNPTGPVGPGAYTHELVSNPSLSVVPASVPFYTSADRALMENTTTSAVTPGPGAYNREVAQDRIKGMRAEPMGNTGAFASATARLHVDKTRNYVPGPGQYTEGNAWLRKSNHYAAPGPQQRVDYKRVPSAPSIPARHQSFGYEEAGPSGALVMQKCPDPVHSGVGVDRPGPGSYNPESGLNVVKVVRSGAGWGQSRAKKGWIKATDVPGPGSYDLVKERTVQPGAIVVNINGVDVTFGGANGSSSFATKVPLASQKLPTDSELTPGPGAYTADRGARKPYVPKDQQFFGTKGRRGFEVDPMTSLSAPTYWRNPGPGAYADPRLRSVSVPRGGAQQRGPQDIVLPFGATSMRFGSDDNGVPGPGDYKPDHEVNLARHVEKHVAVCKGGVFGSTASRFAPAKSMDAMPSSSAPPPGSYNPQPVGRGQTKGETAVFVSRADRFRPETAPPTALDRGGDDADGPPRGDPRKLGPGSYDLGDPWSKVGKKGLQYKKAGFGSDAKRTDGVQKHVVANPGPGRYRNDTDINAVYKPLAVPPKQAGFGSQVTDRFGGPKKYTPGPGAYNTGADFAKRSYNITYTGVEVV